MDRAGSVVGVKGAGDSARARESTRKQLADKVGGDASYGALWGFGMGAAGLAGLGKKRSRR